MDYKIRFATPNDHDLIYTLKAESVRPYVERIWGWDEDYQRNDFDGDFSHIKQFNVIEVDGRFVGFVQYYFEYPYFEVVEIHLLPEYRGKGIGSDILRYLQKVCIAQDRKIRIGCFKENHRAKALYQKLGFTQTEQTDTHYILEYPNYFRDMKQICELNDKIILGLEGSSGKAPRITARAIVKNQDGLYAVMYAEKFKLHSLPGGGVEDGEDIVTALRREVYEETGCVCDEIQELGIVAENRASLDYTQINYYFVVTTTHTPGENHLTEAEQDSRTVVQWHTFDEMVRLINEQEFDRVQGKYLKARDVAALGEYAKWVELYIPRLEDLWFYQKMMSDPETMSYNAGWDVKYDGYHRDTGCIDYPDEVLPDWYEGWVGNEPDCFYAYIKRSSDGVWIGDVNFHYTPEKDWWDMGIVIYAPYRGQGYAVPALKLMLDHAFRDCGISRIHNDFEVARNEVAAWETHRKAGFKELGVEDGFLQMMITKEDYLKCT